MKREELVDYLGGLLVPERFRDYCPNGLQVEGRDRIVRLVAGVTASQALLDAAVTRNADAILVHHGYFWKGEDGRVTGIRRQRLATLLAHDINLLAYHLPLDAHPELGNNAQLAQRLGWVPEGRFGEQDIAWLGSLAAPADLDALAELTRNTDIVVLSDEVYEHIVFDGARSRMETHVQLASGSRYFGWEILCLGRSASGERFANGFIDLRTRIERNGQPLWLERGHIEGNDPLLASRAGWAGASIGGTLLATLPPEIEIAPLLEACRAIAPQDDAEHAMTALPGLLVGRYLGHNSEAARLWFIELWHRLRPAKLD